MRGCVLRQCGGRDEVSRRLIVSNDPIHHGVHSMRAALFSTALGIGLLFAIGASAQTAPSVTATCKDGTTWSGKHHFGACRGHKGVATWSTPAAATPAAAPAAEAPAAAPATKAANPVAPKTGAPGQV